MSPIYTFGFQLVTQSLVGHELQFARFLVAELYRIWVLLLGPRIWFPNFDRKV